MGASRFCSGSSQYEKLIEYVLCLVFLQVYSGVLVYYNRKYGMCTSGLLFLFWLLSMVCGIPEFRTEIRHSQANNVAPEFYGIHLISLIYFILVIIMFLLNCLPDKPPEETLYKKTQVREIKINQ